MLFYIAVYQSFSPNDRVNRIIRLDCRQLTTFVQQNRDRDNVYVVVPPLMSPPLSRQTTTDHSTSGWAKCLDQSSGKANTLMSIYDEFSLDNPLVIYTGMTYVWIHMITTLLVIRRQINFEVGHTISSLHHCSTVFGQRITDSLHCLLVSACSFSWHFWWI